MLSSLLFTLAVRTAGPESHPVWCYDLIISGDVVKQTPHEIPPSPPGELIMEWPWTLDVRVRRVEFGELHARRLKVTAIQHSYMLWRGPKRLYLQRTKPDELLLVGTSGGEPPPRCEAPSASQ